MPDGTPVDTSAWTAGDVAKALLLGYIVYGMATMPKVPPVPTRQPFPIPTFNGVGLVNPGANPGFVEPAPMYGNQQPGIDQYYWGQHAYAQNMSDLANLNTNAVNVPVNPYGNPNAVNLGQLYPLQYPNAMSTAGAYGSLGAAPNQAPMPNMSYDMYNNPVQMNTPAPVVPGYAGAFGPNIQAQMAAGQGPAQQYGQGLNYVALPAQLKATSPASPSLPG